MGGGHEVCAAVSRGRATGGPRRRRDWDEGDPGERVVMPSAWAVQVTVEEAEQWVLWGEDVWGSQARPFVVWIEHRVPEMEAVKAKIAQVGWGWVPESHGCRATGCVENMGSPGGEEPGGGTGGEASWRLGQVRVRGLDAGQ